MGQAHLSRHHLDTGPSHAGDLFCGTAVIPVSSTTARPFHGMTRSAGPETSTMVVGCIESFPNLGFLLMLAYVTREVHSVWCAGWIEFKIMPIGGWARMDDPQFDSTRDSFCDVQDTRSWLLSYRDLCPSGMAPGRRFGIEQSFVVLNGGVSSMTWVHRRVVCGLRATLDSCQARNYCHHES
jgi:hypothetical protein